MRKFLMFIVTTVTFFAARAQNDTSLRIRNYNPGFNLAVDSILSYQFMINKPDSDYYWFLRKSPAGLRINKDNGLLTMRVEKTLFTSGRLKYDVDYTVGLTVQNLNDPHEKVDTTFTITFYNTETVPSKVRPTVANMVNADEGDTIYFKVNCDNGSFPIESLAFTSNYPINAAMVPAQCGQAFQWVIPFDFIKENDKEKTKLVQLYFLGKTKFNVIDTARINLTVKENINYPLMLQEYQNTREDINQYILQLKASFMTLDKKVRKTKSTRTAFDLASATTALGGTVFSSLPSENQKRVGKILPSVGVTLVPVKEATKPNNTYEQNSATLIRSSIKRLEYLLSDNRVIGERDPDIVTKTKKLRSELTQTQVQLIDVPITIEKVDESTLDAYFNNPKVNKKYKAKAKK